jgi:hypothetical protein
LKGPGRNRFMRNNILAAFSTAECRIANDEFRSAVLARLYPIPQYYAREVLGVFRSSMYTPGHGQYRSGIT